jgi:2'-5' RNA ligase
MLIVTSFSTNAREIEESSRGQGADKIVLPSSVFTYKGPDARSVWLGLTPLPQYAVDVVKGIQAQLKTILKGGRYDHENVLHLTLKYLGSISPSPNAENTLEKALSKMLVFPMRMRPEELRILNNRDGTPRLIILVLKSPNLRLFFKSLENALVGFSGRETREFLPHITLYSFPPGSEPLSESTIQKIKEIDLPRIMIKMTGFDLAAANKKVRNGAPIILKSFKSRWSL